MRAFNVSSATFNLQTIVKQDKYYFANYVYENI